MFTVALNEQELEEFHANRGEWEPADYLRLVATRRSPPPPPVPAVNRQEFIRLYQLERELAILAEKVRPDELASPTEVARHIWKLLCETRQELVTMRGTLIGRER